jgi:hypothetical protein
MRPPETVELPELRELLTKCWMTHDAMWFGHCVEDCGIEKANRINRAAVKSMAKVEVRRLMKVLDVQSIEDMGQLRSFLDAAVSLIRADFMKFQPSFPSENTYRWDMPECFAYEGVSRIGVIDQYRCGIFSRLEGWLEGIGVRYSAEPAIDGCMMHSHGHCYREFTIDLP